MSKMETVKKLSIQTNDTIFDALRSDAARVLYLSENNKWLINVILTFDCYDQGIYYYVIDRSNDEINYLHSIFNAMHGKDDVEHLVKISVCHQYSGMEDLPDFVLNRNGKYYFNTNINKDLQTALDKANKDAWLSGSFFK